MIFNFCRHAACEQQRAEFETALRKVLRDPATPRAVRHLAFRKLVELRQGELADEYRRRDLTAFGAVLTGCFSDTKLREAA